MELGHFNKHSPATRETLKNFISNKKPPTFIKKKHLPLDCLTIFEDEIVNNKAFEHTNLIYTGSWALTNEIMFYIMQNFKLDFLKNEF